MARKHRNYKPYALLTGLLYGKFDWLDRRDGGEVVLPVRATCAHFRMEPKDLKSTLAHLRVIGVVEYFTWHSTWAVVRAAVPRGMRREEIDVSQFTIEIDESSGAI